MAHPLRRTALIVALAFASPTFAADEHAHHAHYGAATASAEELAKGGDPYPLTIDALTGEPLGEKPVTVDHGGRQLRFTNSDNAAAFAKDAEASLAKLDKRMADDQRPHYPLDTCIVSGEKLDAGKAHGHGELTEVVFRNRLVRLCCPHCSDDLSKNPAKVIAKLDAAVIEKQTADYPLPTCPISTQPLGAMGEPHNVVIANRLVRLCCEGCVDQLKATAPTVLGQIDAARQAKASEHGNTTQPAGHGSHDHHGHSH